MIAIYSPYNSKRLDYILSHIFKTALNIDYKHTTSKSSYMDLDGIKLNYSHEPICKGELLLKPSGTLLEETGLQVFEPEVMKDKPCPYIFASAGGSVYYFDIFAAAFYMLSRYEEYLPFIKDMHGRFQAESSMAYRHGFLHKPVVDIWINDFRVFLEKFFNKEIPEHSKYHFTPTIDIDVAYAYKSKGVYRNIFGYLRSFLGGQWDELSERLRVNLGKAKDPYDTFDDILECHQKYGLKTIFFVLVGDYSTYDKNAPYKDNKFRQLIRHLSDYADIGIHPSYTVEEFPKRLSEEIKRLSDIIRKDITISRHHYLKNMLPGAYRSLTANGIKEDYTMGFPSQVGFRAATSKPFYFFDLDANASTSLKVNPISIMDGTLKDYLKKEPAEAQAIIENTIEEVKNVKGHFISLFHNQSLNNRGEWKNWLGVYEEMLKKAL